MLVLIARLACKEWVPNSGTLMLVCTMATVLIQTLHAFSVKQS